MLPHQVLGLARLLRDERLDLATLKKIQGGKLRRLIRHAYANVPYYHAMFASHGIRPEHIRDVDDLAMIPLTDKSTFQKIPLGERTAPGRFARGVRTIMTSGSTGAPLKILIRREDLTLRNLVSARSNLASGLKPWHKIGVVILTNVESKKSWYEHLGLWRRKEISSQRTPEEWLEVFQAWRPDVLVGRMSTLRLLAETAEKAGRGRLRPRLVFSSAEMLDETSRRFMTGVFRCSVLDYYYAFEGGCLAWECPRCGGYHLNSDVVIVEVLQDGKSVEPGGEGEVVITNLHAYAMPFIRYSLGDRVVVSEKRPSCGRHLPLIERIRGRADDYLRLADGRTIAPQAVSWVFMNVPGVKKWQVVQDRPDHIQLDIEPSQDFSPETRRLLLEGMKKLLRVEVAVDLRVVDSIPQDPVHKYRSVVTSFKRN